VQIGHPLYQFFLPKEYAIAIPSILLTVGLLVVGIALGFLLVKESQKSKRA
jgi:hypothetical protein